MTSEICMGILNSISEDGGRQGKQFEFPRFEYCPSRWTRANEDKRGSKSASGCYDREARPKNGVVIDKNMKNP